MSVASQSGMRPIDVNGGEEVVAVGSGDPGSLSEEKEEETEAGEEERGVVKMLDPRQPSEEERLTHYLTHLHCNAAAVPHLFPTAFHCPSTAFPPLGSGGIKPSAAVRGCDIGTGASCIYPLLGVAMHRGGAQPKR